MSLPGNDLTEPPPISASGTATAFAQVMADIVGVERVPVDSHFFDDLGANSLLMAQFCARVRKRADLPSVSIKDVYRNPTSSSLATAVSDSTTPLAEPAAPTEPATPTAPTTPAAAAAAAAVADPTTPVAASAAAQVAAETPPRAGTLAYVGCGALQLLFFVGYSCVVAVVLVLGIDWISAGASLLDYYLRSVVFGSGLLCLLCTLPIAVKWLVIGRWRPRRIPVWSPAYVRFWIVKTVVQRNPLVLRNPLRVEDVFALAASGERVPQKSTSFGPKPRSGLVLRLFTAA